MVILYTFTQHSLWHLLSYSSSSTQETLSNHTTVDQTRYYLDSYSIKLSSVKGTDHVIKWNHNVSIPFLNHNMSDEDITTGKSQYEQA